MTTRPYSRGRWAVERERCQLTGNPPAPERAARLPDLLDGVMKSLRLDYQFWMQKLAADWPDLVGEQVARRTRPGSLQRRTLVVFVENSVWLGELNRMRATMLANLQARYGAERIRSLRLQLDPEPRSRE
jgi:hypothetical protein